MKKILIGLVVLIIIIAGAAYYLFSNLDNIVKAAIEKYGSEVTQTSVNVSSVHIGLTDGLGTIKNLVIGNPKGFDSDYLFQMDNIGVQLNLDKISKDLIIINQIMLDGPSIIYELNNTTSNVDVVKKNVDAYAGSGAENKERDQSAGPKLIIENFIIKNGDVKAVSNMVKDKTLSTKLPTIHLRDIGKETGGATSAEVSKIIITELTKETKAAAGDLDLRSLMNEEMLKNLDTETLKDVDKLKGLEKEVGDKLKKMF